MKYLHYHLLDVLHKSNKKRGGEREERILKLFSNSVYTEITARITKQLRLSATNASTRKTNIKLKRQKK